LFCLQLNEGFQGNPLRDDGLARFEHGEPARESALVMRFDCLPVRIAECRSSSAC